MQFKIVKKGYDVNEVNKYIKNQEMSNSLQSDKQKDRINQLLNENEVLKTKLAEYIAKENNISNALLVAVAKAKQIEDGSKKIYELEIQKLRLLFNKYKLFLDDLIKANANNTNIKTTQTLIEQFRKSINNTLMTNFNKDIKTISAYDPMHTLINKMSNYIAKRNSDASKVLNTSYEDCSNTDTHIYEKANLKPIANVELSANDDFENIVDKFLEVGDEEANAFAKQILLGNDDPKNNGFDLKEAVNPTESLEEIMKSFDFYDGDKD